MDQDGLGRYAQGVEPWNAFELRSIFIRYLLTYSYLPKIPPILKLANWPSGWHIYKRQLDGPSPRTSTCDGVHGNINSTYVKDPIVHPVLYLRKCRHASLVQ